MLLMEIVPLLNIHYPEVARIYLEDMINTIQATFQTNSPSWKIGKMRNIWRYTILLERRSLTTGKD